MLNELIAHSIECVHASISIRKQGEPICLTDVSLCVFENISTGGKATRIRKSRFEQFSYNI